MLDILDADHTFLNEELAEHYGIPGVTGAEWRRVDGVKKFGRGGILGQATTLAKQSGASRTSPILRGNWISEVLLGERLPRPPKGVPPLPDDEVGHRGPDRPAARRKTHAATPSAPSAIVGSTRSASRWKASTRSAACARRTWATGRSTRDAKTLDGTALDGLDGLAKLPAHGPPRGRSLRQFCRKLLGYALGRCRAAFRRAADGRDARPS